MELLNFKLLVVVQYLFYFADYFKHLKYMVFESVMRTKTFSTTIKTQIQDLLIFLDSLTAHHKEVIAKTNVCKPKLHTVYYHYFSSSRV